MSKLELDSEVRFDNLIVLEKDLGGETFSKFLASFFKKLNLDTHQQNRLIEKGGEFQEKLKQLIIEYPKVETYANEEVPSKYGYLSGYKKPKGITEQTNKLRVLFPGIGYANETITQGILPNNTEGWFAIPKWQSIAPTYGEAVEKVFIELKKLYNGNFINYWEGKLGSNYLRQIEKTAKCFEFIAEQQKGYDILVVPAQFGLLHRGQSVRRIRSLMDDTSEFGLGIFAVSIMLLTHPERLMNYDDLWVDCAGDEFAPDGGGVFSRAPVFDWRGELWFYARDVSGPRGGYGSASGFVPQV